MRVTHGLINPKLNPKPKTLDCSTLGNMAQKRSHAPKQCEATVDHLVSLGIQTAQTGMLLRNLNEVTTI